MKGRLAISDTSIERKSAQEANAGIDAFAAERVELFVVIVMLAFMISIIDETFRLGMYAVIAVALLLFGYNYMQNAKNAPPEELQAQEGVESYSTLSGARGK